MYVLFILCFSFHMVYNGICEKQLGGFTMDGTFLLLAGGLLIIIVAVIIAVISSVVSGVVASEDIED